MGSNISAAKTWQERFSQSSKNKPIAKGRTCLQFYVDNYIKQRCVVQQTAIIIQRMYFQFGEETLKTAKSTNPNLNRYTQRRKPKKIKDGKIRLTDIHVLENKNSVRRQTKTKIGGNMNIRNEIKSYIVREGLTRSEVVEKLLEEHGWSSSVPSFSGKLQRGSPHYSEAEEFADVLSCEPVWQKRGG